jgi:hypothetical protein
MSESLSRRKFFGQAGVGAVALAAGSQILAEAPHKGKADHCIFLWLGGGAAHIDTFDPKRRGDFKKIAGSAYDAIPTAVSGVNVCQHLARTAKLLDRCVLVRSLNHDVIDEHAAAVNRMHTGRPTSGTIVYPSIGSVVAHERGPAGQGVPAYVVMGYPNVTRGPGFLGAKHGYVYLTETDIGPNGLTRPPDVDAERQARREAMLAKLREEYLKKHPGDETIQAYAQAAEEGFKLAGPKFLSVFDLKQEPASLREAYGGEFGQRCLLARRLIQSGVRFIEVAFNLNFVNGTGWDTHNDGQKNQHILIDQLDQAFSALVTDLEQKKLFDRTLIVISTEFGRPPEFDAGGGRGHQSKAFSSVLAGGGLKTGQAIGVTDELGKTILQRPVSVPDFHATIYTALGVNPARELKDGDRPVPITDGGKAIGEVMA